MTEGKELQTIFADLHIHVGRDKFHRPVKITGGKSLTVTNILKEASRNKGLQMIGIVDCHVPTVQQELQDLMDDGQAQEKTDGGIQFEEVTLILGSEIEIYDAQCKGPIHVLCFFPTLEKMKQFTAWLRHRMNNINLSSQRYYGEGRALQHYVKQLNGLFIPAHIFTPFKSLYGKGVIKSLSEVFDSNLIDAMELGLSADTSMADQITELHPYTYLSNSDAHSLSKIAREYQKIAVKQASFTELADALKQQNQRRIVANYGMNPKLGKYYRTVCQHCFNPSENKQVCSVCGSSHIIRGVFDRILSLQDNKKKAANNRPAYVHQVPLEYIKGLGPATYQKLLQAFSTEMTIIHHTPYENLKEVASESIANQILQMRNGLQRVRAGGGGKYGKLLD